MEVVESIAKMTAAISSAGTIRVRFFLALFAALAAHVFAPAARAQESVIQLDPAQTKIEFTLGDVFHIVHGTFKLNRGTVQFDPSTGRANGTIVVDATSGDSGNRSRDRRMHRDILESDKFPEIIFTPSQMKGALAPQRPSRVEVSGHFRLHGQDQDVTLPIDIQPAGQQLQFATHITIPYVQWGLRDPSTLFLRVGKVVEIDIHAVGQLVRSEGSR